ncbi:MAG: SoxR reducing system RseC family protein [Clostridia bacterium]|nr:SoxR reducing system RseC family protein [Clostridia bacterium]
MKVKATVKDINYKYAIVESRRYSACEGCHKSNDGCSVCSLLGSDKVISVKVKNTLNANIGDEVEIESDTKTVVFYAFIVFFLPIVMMIAIYFISSLYTKSEFLRCILALSGLAFAFFGLWLYSKFNVSKRCDSRIVRIIKKEDKDGI